MFHLGWFMTTGFGVYGWGSPWAGNGRDDVGQPDLFVETARSLERAGFDYVMLEDSSVLPNVYRGSFEASVKRAGSVRFDPMPLAAILSQNTSRLGIIATAATTFYPPFLAARLYGTLDHLTHGRVGMNLVTASPHQAAQNYGLTRHVEHDERYLMAAEWVEAVTALFSSWEEDALLLDETGPFADHTKIHPADFEGQYYSTRGPLNFPPGPQGRPVICQAGGSSAGREFGAKYADTIIAGVPGVGSMKGYRDEISERMLAHGRKPDQAKVLFLVDPVLADSQAEAEEIHRAKQEAIAADIDGALAAMSYFTSTDFSQFDLDAPFPDLSGNNGHRSTMSDWAGSGRTLREAITQHRVTESVSLVGTPDSVAARMVEAMDEVGGDGFLIASPVTRRNVSQVTDGLAAALRRRGAIRDGYEFSTLRENLLAF